MATRLSKKNQGDEAQEAPTQRKQAEGRYRLQVDRQTKATYPTWEAAEKAGLAIKKSYPVVQVGVYDHVRQQDHPVAGELTTLASGTGLDALALLRFFRLRIRNSAVTVPLGGGCDPDSHWGDGAGGRSA